MRNPQKMSQRIVVVDVATGSHGVSVTHTFPLRLFFPRFLVGSPSFFFCYRSKPSINGGNLGFTGFEPNSSGFLAGFLFSASDFIRWELKMVPGLLLIPSVDLFKIYIFFRL